MNTPLNDSQKKIVSNWIVQGESLANIQRLLRDEFSISMTYMDVRFLVDDLGVVAPDIPADEVDETDDTVEEPEVIEEGLVGGVSVDVDAVTPPGALMSGNVTFSDGEALGWQLLSNGQLGLVPGDNPDYRPSSEDMQDFRVKMDELLRKKGFGA